MPDQVTSISENPDTSQFSNDETAVATASDVLAFSVRNRPFSSIETDEIAIDRKARELEARAMMAEKLPPEVAVLLLEDEGDGINTVREGRIDEALTNFSEGALRIFKGDLIVIAPEKRTQKSGEEAFCPPPTTMVGRVLASPTCGEYQEFSRGYWVIRLRRTPTAGSNS